VNERLPKLRRVDPAPMEPLECCSASCERVDGEPPSRHHTRARREDERNRVDGVCARRGPGDRSWVGLGGPVSKDAVCGALGCAHQLLVAPAQKTLTSARDRSTLIASFRASWDALLRRVLQGRLELKLTSDCQNGGAWIEWRREPLRCCSVSRVDGEPLSRHRMWDQAWVRALRILEFKRDVAALVAALVAAIAAAIAANGMVRMRNCMTIALVHLMHSASCEPAHL
jgi:hypothetical protein